MMENRRKRVSQTESEFEIISQQVVFVANALPYQHPPRFPTSHSLGIFCSRRDRASSRILSFQSYSSFCLVIIQNILPFLPHQLTFIPSFFDFVPSLCYLDHGMKPDSLNSSTLLTASKGESTITDGRWPSWPGRQR